MTDFGDTDPLIEHGDDDNDDDEGATNPFQSSTPGPSGDEIPMTTMNREREKGAPRRLQSQQGWTHHLSRVLQEGVLTQIP